MYIRDRQNTMRDALVAAVTLNIFNKHCDRVKMACIAQLINVLQSVILTEGEKMILTPTYHIFHMYKYHQDAELLRSDLTGVDTIQNGEFSIPALQESVSVQKDGTITVTSVSYTHLDVYKRQGRKRSGGTRRISRIVYGRFSGRGCRNCGGADFRISGEPCF